MFKMNQIESEEKLLIFLVWAVLSVFNLSFYQVGAVFV